MKINYYKIMSAIITVKSNPNYFSCEWKEIDLKTNYVDRLLIKKIHIRYIGVIKYYLIRDRGVSMNTIRVSSELLPIFYNSEMLSGTYSFPLIINQISE